MGLRGAAAERLGQDFADRVRQLHRLLFLVFPEFTEVVRNAEGNPATATGNALNVYVTKLSTTMSDFSYFLSLGLVGPAADMSVNVNLLRDHGIARHLDLGPAAGVGLRHAPRSVEDDGNIS